MSAKMSTYKRRDGTSAEHGHKFEMDLTVLTYVRCLKLFRAGKLKSFMIANNMDCVGAFDDVVCRIEYDDKGSLHTKLIFIQAKHKEKPSKIAKSDVSFTTPKMKRKTEGAVLIGNKPINEYIISYLQTRKIFKEEEDCETFTGKKQSEDESKTCREKLNNVFNCQLEDSIFLFYSNAIDDGVTYFDKIRDIEEITTIFDTSANNGIYKLKLENLKLSQIMNEKYKVLSVDEKYRIDQFKEQFKIYMNQERQGNLEIEIENEIRDIIADNHIDTSILESLYSNLYKEIKQYFSLDQSPFLSEAQNFVEGINALLKLQFQTKKILYKYSEWSQMIENDIVENIHKDLLECKFMKIYSNSLTRIIRLVYFTQIAERMNKSEMDIQSVLFLYINDDNSLQMWKTFRTLHIYTKYSLVFLCTDIEVRSEDVHKIWSIKGETRERIICISDDHPTFEPSLRLALSPESKRKIMNYDKITFQGIPSIAKYIFGNSDCQEILKLVIQRVLKNEKLIFGSFLPEEDNIYIERKYKKNTTLLKFEAIKEKMDIFVIQQNHINTNFLNIHNSSNVFIYENKEDGKNKYLSLVEKNQNVHFCLGSELLLEVIFSKGDLKNISKFIIDQTDEEDAETFLQHILSHKITILSDDVGMGKTTALKRLTHCIKKKYKQCWAQYIDLHSQNKSLMALKTTVDPIDFIATDMLKLDHENKMIFQHKCNKEGDVAMLFDGFDEMAIEYRGEFLRFLKALSDTKIKIIVIATRTIVADELKVFLENFCFSLLGFNYEDMALYLKQYWSIKEYNDEQQLKLTQFVSNIVEHIKENKKTLTAIASVPLQTKMLASTYSDEMKKALLMKNHTNFKLGSLNLYSLYNNFINMHINRCIEEKIKLHETSNFYHIIKNMYKGEADKWESFACNEMFPSIEICEVKTTDTDLQTIQQIGIIVNIDPIKFLHRSFAEFLAAKHITRLLFECKSTKRLNYIYQKILIDNTFTVLRKFMNTIYESESSWKTADINFVPGLEVDDNVLAVAVEEKNSILFKVILRHLSKNESILVKILNKKDKLNESLLHKSMYCEQVFDAILYSECFHCAKDGDVDGLTAFHEACRFGRENIVKLYIHKFKDILSEIIELSSKGFRTPLMMAADNGHTNIVKILLHHGASLHKQDVLGMNALMSASCGSHIETVKYLIEQGAHINEQGIEKKTVLSDACINIDKYVDGVGYIRYLVEQAGADVNIKDQKEQTALMYLLYTNANIGILKCLIQYGADIKAVNSDGKSVAMIAAENSQVETVKYLFELGVDILNEADANGDTCFTLCSGAENTTVLKYFIEEHKPNLDYRNNEGETALFRAVSIFSIENVKLLIKHGASVNICNNKGSTALSTMLDFAVEWKYISIFGNSETFLSTVSYLVQHGADINQHDHLENSILHLLLHLEPVEEEVEEFINLIKLLVQIGADINLKNKDGVTPAMIAQNHENPKVISSFQTLIKSKVSSSHC